MWHFIKNKIKILKGGHTKWLDGKKNIDIAIYLNINYTFIFSEK